MFGKFEEVGKCTFDDFGTWMRAIRAKTWPSQQKQGATVVLWMHGSTESWEYKCDGTTAWRRAQ